MVATQGGEKAADIREDSQRGGYTIGRGIGPAEGGDQLKILQYNVDKSYEIMTLLFAAEEINSYDIIAIQEPYLNTMNAGYVLTHYPNPDNYHLVFLGTEESRVATFVNKRWTITQWMLVLNESYLTKITLFG